MGTINEMSRTAGIGLAREVTASLILLGKKPGNNGKGINGTLA